MSPFSDVEILVVGDVMLDRYVRGRAEKVSPEAPVMILQQDSVENKPGGAANVAVNCKAFGARRVSLYGMIGVDDEGEILHTAIRDAGIFAYLLQEARCTTVKTRFMAGNHQLLRTDKESKTPSIDLLHSSAGASSVVIVSDYGKGVVSKKLMQNLVKSGSLIVVNGKPQNVELYQGCHILTLNKAEYDELRYGPREWPCTWPNLFGLIVTKGSEGIEFFGRDNRRFSVPARQVELADATGAGDTVVAAIAMGLGAFGFNQIEGVVCSAATLASLCCERVGVSHPTPEEIDCEYRSEELSCSE